MGVATTATATIVIIVTAGGVDCSCHRPCCQGDTLVDSRRRQDTPGVKTKTLISGDRVIVNIGPY